MAAPGGSIRPEGAGRLGYVFVVVAVVVLAAGLFYAFVLPQTPVRIDRASAALVDDLGLWDWLTSGWLPVPRTGGSVAAFLILFGVVFFAAYAAAIYIAWNRVAARRTLAAVAATSVAFLAISALALPTQTTDIFDYILFGRVAAVHGENPYEVPPSAFPDDPIYPYASETYRVRPDNKLPAWMLVNRTLAELPGDDPVANLLAYRFTLFAVNVGNLVLIALLLRTFFPTALLAGIIVYGWNPVVIVYGQSKTDTVMVFFFLLGLLAVARGRDVAAAVPFAFSTLVKLITLPFVAVYWLRDLVLRRWRRLAIQSCLLAGVTVAVYAPFGFGLLKDHLGLFGQGGGGGSAGGTDAPSPAPSALSDVPRPLLVTVLAVVVLAVALRQNGTAVSLLRGFSATAVAFGLLFANPRSPWYLITMVAVAAVAPDWRVISVIGSLCFGAFLFTAWRSVSNAEFPLPDLVDVPSATVFVVPLVLLGLIVAAVWLRRRRAGARAGSAQ